MELAAEAVELVDQEAQEAVQEARFAATTKAVQLVNLQATGAIVTAGANGWVPPSKRWSLLR